MAEKYSVLIKYKYLEYIENARLSDADSWILIRSVIEYDKTGEEPQYQNPILYGLFAVIKSDLDKNRENWNKVSETKSNNGKQGGAPKGNQNARKNNQNNLNQPKQPNACFSDKNNQNNLKQHDSGGDLDYAFVNEKSGSSGNGEKQPPLFLIKTKIKEHGFFLDDDKLLERLIAGTDPPWFEGRHSFIDFIAETVREEYGDKPKREQHRVFRKLLFDAPNLREAYPGWRQKQEKNDALRADEEVLKVARENHPAVCGNCGAKLLEYNESLYCNICWANYTFSQESWKWDYHRPTESSLSEDFKDMLRQMQGEMKE